MKKNPYFWIFLLIKIALFPAIPATVAHDLFIPFLDNAVTSLGQNPWNSLPAYYFPYGSVLFAIMIIPKTLFYLIAGDAALGLKFLSLVALKLPILIADVCLLRLLLTFPSAHQKKWIYYFYWMNPVLIFINYIHVQLDIFAVLFVILSLFLLKNKKEMVSAVALACAILCKFHVALLAPLFIAYFWNNKFNKEARLFIFQWTWLLLALVFLGLLPHILSRDVAYISFKSPEAMKIFSLTFKLDGRNELFIGFGIVIAVLSRLVLSSRITVQGMIYASGVLLALLLITTSAMPGWYYWFYPFVALFLSQYVSRLHLVALGSFVFYLLYFIPDYFNHKMSLTLTSISFSVLQMSLVGLVISIWFYVLRLEMPFMRRNRPLLIGIAGDSGAGKNTFAQTLFDLFGQNATSLIEGDDYHKWERGDEKWQDYSHLNPRANYLETLAQHVQLLLQGQPIYKSQYDHAIGRFTSERQINAQKNIIVQGLHTFYPILMRKICDIKIFISPNEKLRLFWKIKRDHLERGKTLESVIQSLQSRQYDSLLHISPQRQYSDWILEYIPADKSFFATSIEKWTMADFAKTPDLIQVHRVLNDTPVDALINELRTIKTLTVHCEVDENDMDFLKIQVQGNIKAVEVEKIAIRIFGTLRHLTRSGCRPIWQSNYEGINQLIFMVLVLRREFLQQGT